MATSYAADRGRSLQRFLGDGNDGAVWESDQQSAIKALERRDSYLRERDAYLRLQDLGIFDIQGFSSGWLAVYGLDWEGLSGAVLGLPSVLWQCLLATHAQLSDQKCSPGHGDAFQEE